MAFANDAGSKRALATEALPTFKKKHCIKIDFLRRHPESGHGGGLDLGFVTMARNVARAVRARVTFQRNQGRFKMSTFASIQRTSNANQFLAGACTSLFGRGGHPCCLASLLRKTVEVEN